MPEPAADKERERERGNERVCECEKDSAICSKAKQTAGRTAMETWCIHLWIALHLESVINLLHN